MINCSNLLKCWRWLFIKCDVNGICHSGRKINSLLTSNYLFLSLLDSMCPTSTSTLTAPGQWYLLRWHFSCHQHSWFSCPDQCHPIANKFQTWLQKKDAKISFTFPSLRAPQPQFLGFSQWVDGLVTLNEWMVCLVILPDWIANRQHHPHTGNALQVHSLGFEPQPASVFFCQWFRFGFKVYAKYICE